MDASQVVVPDSTKAEDEEVLNSDDGLDGSVAPPGGVLFLEYGGRGVDGGVRFWDWVFRGWLRRTVAE